MKNTLLCGLALLFAGTLPAQYFYNDLLGSQATMGLMKTYRENRVRHVSATGLDENNVKATDFLEFHEVKDNGNTLKITYRTAAGHSVTHHRFNAQGQLISTVDSSDMQTSTITYSYDNVGRITKLENQTNNPGGDFQVTETHAWQYDESGKPKNMWRIISGSANPVPDTTEIRFLPDDLGNTGDEVTYRNNRETGRIYYYYDERGRVTDIVRYNTKLERLMPDVMFEYDEADRVIQKITTTSDRTVTYLIWRFVFDGKGLKTKEALFDNYRQLKGKIEYAYTYY